MSTIEKYILSCGECGGFSDVNIDIQEAQTISEIRLTCVNCGWSGLVDLTPRPRDKKAITFDVKWNGGNND